MISVAQLTQWEGEVQHWRTLALDESEKRRQFEADCSSSFARGLALGLVIGVVVVLLFV
jgi:hypothetical protein